MRPAIRVENLSKCYRVNDKKRTGQNLSETIAATARVAWDKVRQLADPNAKQAGTHEFWALKDVSFEVQPGEVVGIIGRNGAGKSTLLKILSQIVEPTGGYAEIDGRVSSLLEVGTGFHPELTGRENVYLNATILGMSRREIAKKFDEIVDFSGVEEFLDTPVKRYSSGMYVRLAFAVAAHLESEILIVDEVLAVGDQEFQNKCMGKMNQVASHGKSILFVSHNLAAVRSMCDRAIVLKAGSVIFNDDADSAVSHYFGVGDAPTSGRAWDENEAPEGNGVVLSSVSLTDDQDVPLTTVEYNQPFVINIGYLLRTTLRGVRIGIEVKSIDGIVVFGTTDYCLQTNKPKFAGRYRSKCLVPSHTLNSGVYSITIGSDLALSGTSFYEENCTQIVVVDREGHGADYIRPPGLTRPNVRWEVAGC